MASSGRNERGIKRLRSRLTGDLLHHRICPVRRRGDTLLVARTERTIDSALAELRDASGTAILAHHVSDAEVDQPMERVTSTRERQRELATVRDEHTHTTDAREIATERSDSRSR